MNVFAKKMLRNIRNSHGLFSVLGLVFLVVLSSLLSDRFLRVSNLITILRQASILLILSVGLTGVVISNGVDLSISAIAAFVGCCSALLLKSGMPIFTMAVVGVLIGGVIGLFNGFLVGRLNLPPFVATYGTMLVVGGLSLIMMQGGVIYGLPESFTWYGVGYMGPFPVPVVISLVVVIFFYVLLKKTTFGRDIYMIGSNKTAASYSAIPVRRRLLSIYSICGMTAGLAGLILTARLNAAEVAMGDAFGLQTVAAVVIGGTSLMGGTGGPFGTVIGALILTIVVNTMNLIGLSSFVQPIVIGVVIIGTVFMDAFSKRQ
jgi:ribose transport system permease protein